MSRNHHLCFFSFTLMRYFGRKSCTVLINGVRRCIRDDDEWKDCEGGYKVHDFVRSIKEAYYGPIRVQ